MNFNKNLYIFIALLLPGRIVYHILESFWRPNESTINVNVYHCTTNNPNGNCSLIKWNWVVHSVDSLSLDHVSSGNSNSFLVTFKHSTFSVRINTICGNIWSRKFSISRSNPEKHLLWVNLEFMLYCDVIGNCNQYEKSEYLKFVWADFDDGKPDNIKRSFGGSVRTLAVNVYNCEISILNPKEKCSGALFEEDLRNDLPKDQWVRLEYSNYGYSMEAILIGQYFCVKNRYFNVDSAEYINTKTCQKMLGPKRVEKLLAVYEESKICDESAPTRSCEFAKQKYLKFVNRDNDKNDDDLQRADENTSQSNVSLLKSIATVGVMLLILLTVLIVILVANYCILNYAKKNEPYYISDYVEKNNPYYKMT